MRLYDDLVLVTLCRDRAGSIAGNGDVEEDPIDSSSSQAF